MDRFVVPPRDDAKRQPEWVPGAWEMADQVRHEGKGWGFVRWSAVSCPYSVNGNAKHRLGRARGPGQNGRGGRPRDELNAWPSRSGACRLPSEKALRDLRVRHLGRLCDGPFILALNFCSFSFKRNRRFDEVKRKKDLVSYSTVRIWSFKHW